MKRYTTLFFTFLMVGLIFGQGKYAKFLSSKKLALSFKKVKESEKEDFYQQYYWLVKAEELKSYPHLSSIKPKVLYEFVKKVNPQNKTKKLDKKGKELRDNAELSLDQYFKNKNTKDNKVLMYNLETYVDPSHGDYYTKVDPERVKELLPKEIYGFTSYNRQTKEEKNYYFWINKKKDDFEFVELIPAKDDDKFYKSLKQYLPKYTFDKKYMPSIKKGTKSDKTDKDYYYITPFDQNKDNIEYKTKDFYSFILSQVKKEGEGWIGVEIPRK